MAMSRKAPEMSLRQYAVRQGRAMVRVRSLETREPATIGVCPACFNLKKRREVLLLQLAKMGYEVVHPYDRLDGLYRPGRRHAPGCRYGHLATDSWREFASAVKRAKKHFGREGEST
jgi:hypothetical protein